MSDTRPIAELVFKPSVVRRALVMGLIVGCVIAAINHGDRILSGSMAAPDWIRAAITFLVPYTVSTISSVLALREQDRLIADLRRKQDAGAPLDPEERIVGGLR